LIVTVAVSEDKLFPTAFVAVTAKIYVFLFFKAGIAHEKVVDVSAVARQLQLPETVFE
jgi:hypothetical protein